MIEYKNSRAPSARTFASGCAALGVGEHIVDRVLNHSGRKVSGTARIYNRHEYLKERQAALDIWADHVMRLVQLKAVDGVVA